MFGTSTSGGARQILGTFTTLQIRPPKSITDATDRLERVTAGIRNLGSGSKGLPEAAAAALADGREPSTDPAVQAILVNGALNQIAEEVVRVANEQLTETAAGHADQIVTAWRKPFGQAADALAEAHSVLGSVPLEATDEIVRRGGDAAEAWGRAQRAAGTIDQIVSGWVGLATLAHVSLTRHYMMLRIADVNPATWIADQLTEQKLSPWQIVCAGYPLSLPTLAEYQQRIRAVDQARVQLEAVQMQQAHDRMTGRNTGRTMVGAPQQ